MLLFWHLILIISEMSRLLMRGIKLVSTMALATRNCQSIVNIVQYMKYRQKLKFL